MNGWAVFNGTTKSFGAAGSGSTVSLNVGTTYRIYGVSGDGNGTEGYATISVTPAAPVDTTAPTTTSDAKATYMSSAAIKLAATDNIGGSGVAHTYYILDGGTQTEGTIVGTSVVGTHTVEFLSADASGNVEAPHNNPAFTVTVTAPPLVSTYKVTVRINFHHANYKHLSVVLRNSATGAKFTAKVDRKGYIVFKNVPTGTYRLSVSGKHFKFKTRTINVGTRNLSVRFK